MIIMKKLSVLALGTMIAGLLSVALVSRAADDKKPKPYPLDTCVVADEKLGEDPGMQPYTFVHEGREVKLCCKSCLKDFKKDTAKYIAKIDAAEKKKAK
jgi:hypothetical protein